MPSKQQQVLSRFREAKEKLASDSRGALKIAEALSEELEGPSEIQGEVLSLLGLARRICGDQEGAHEAFQRACRVEASPLSLGHAHCQWALLELDRRRHDEALRKVARGLELIESAEPSPRDVAQGLLSRAIVLCHTERCDEAENDIRRVLGLVHPRQDADLQVKALQNLGLVLLKGAREPRRVQKALKILDEANGLLRKHRIRLKSLQNASVLWIRSLALRLVGADERAETLLLRARDILFYLGAVPQWTSLSLDLIEIYMHYGRWGMVKRTLGEILDHAKDAEVLAAVAIFYDAIRADAVNVTEEILRDVYSKVHGDRRQPPELGLAEMADDSEPIGF